jgi:hypothetical protein
VPPPDGAAPDWEVDDAVLLEWPRYGRPLERMETVVEDARVLQGAYNEHHGHAGFRPFTDPLARTAGIVCHCLAPAGRSVVYTVPLRVLKEMPPELLREVFPDLVDRAQRVTPPG